jgi:hypothetical protein
MLTEAAIIAIAKAFEAGFNYAAEHERGMTPEQRQTMAQWTVDDIKAVREFFQSLKDRLPGS